MEKETLAVFTVACQQTLRSEDFLEKRSLIKRLFVERDFAQIFGNEALLGVYVADYAPSRALCYQHLFSKEPLLRKLMGESGQVLCLGGGAGSEMVGLGVVIAQMAKTNPKLKAKLVLQDIADYRVVLDDLEKALRQIHRVSVDQLVYEHAIYDLADATHQSEFLSTSLQSSHLVTACFILNEILSASKSNFVRLVGCLVKSMRIGSYLLVIDSAGSFSEVDVGEQTVMCYHLLDPLPMFKCVLRKDAEWYRLPTGLMYPSKLNNMRYFLRLYQKVK